jgi:hypothetical protein
LEWIADTELASEHLKSFLTAFSTSNVIVENVKSVEFLSEDNEFYKQAFDESFLKVDQKAALKNLNMVIIYYTAGSINSRKAMISPYLPNIE